jgi:TMEM70/TMEM186/TMEM223 protein family
LSTSLSGYGILAAAWFFTLRSVRYLVLLKNGEVCSFVTYGPFGKNRIMDVPLKAITAEQTRQTARVHLPIKVRSRKFFYILDMRGEFLNTRLFDHTVGLKRKIE